MTPQRACVLAAGLLAQLLVACTDTKPAPVDSVAATDSVPALVEPAAPNTGWESSTAGEFLLLPVTENSAAALVVLPSHTDSTLTTTPELPGDLLAGATVELFSRSGLAGSTTLSVDRGTHLPEGCLSWPQARLSDVVARPWRIGFVKGMVAAIPLDSLETMSAADSVFLTRELARISSAVAEGDDPAYRGLPFAVRKAYRFAFGSTSIIAGDVVRKINEEANPREERLFLLAERPLAATAEYGVAFSTRVAGAEDAIRTNEVLGAVRLVRTNRPAIVMSFEYFDGGRIALLQRTGNREWKTTWQSAYTGC